MTNRRLLRSASLVVVLASGPAPTGDLQPPLVAATLARNIAVEDLSRDIEQVVEWALGLFEQAGLELPPLVIRHHGADIAQCDGHTGVHRSSERGNVIELCTDGTNAGTEATVLHELAHAWVDHNVTQERRDEFQAVRGYEHWRDYAAAAWHENGTEQAAEIIAWGLFDRPRAVIRIHQNSCDDLELGYRILTGQPPLHGFRDLCPP